MRAAFNQTKAEAVARSGGWSEHLAMLDLYTEWTHLPQGGVSSRFVRQNFLSSGGLKMAHGVRQQVQGDLRKLKAPDLAVALSKSPSWVPDSQRPLLRHVMVHRRLTL